MLRPILLAFALTAAAATTSAAAAPSGLSPLPIGFAPGGHGPGFTGGFRFGSGIGRLPFRGMNRHRHRWSRDAGYASAGYAEGVPLGEQAPAYADGFFSDGEARTARGGVRYDYDRGYPYEFYRPDDMARPAAYRPAPAAAECTMEHAVRVCRR